MILLDCGNSWLKAQWRGADGLWASFGQSYDGDWCGRLQRRLCGLPGEHCYLVSVLDRERQRRLDACLHESCGDKVTRFESRDSAGGVRNGYTEPERLGDDRWLAMIGAAGLVEGDCFIVDAGSAMTLDLLRGDGRHLGGAILPGLNTSLERFRQIFGYIDFGHPDIREQGRPGCSTEAAIQIDYPHRSIDRLRDLLTDWQKHLEPNASLLLTGGDAPRVWAELGQRGRIVPDLVFLGIHRLATA